LSVGIIRPLSLGNLVSNVEFAVSEILFGFGLRIPSYDFGTGPKAQGVKSSTPPPTPPQHLHKTKSVSASKARQGTHTKILVICLTHGMTQDPSWSCNHPPAACVSVACFFVSPPPRSLRVLGVHPGTPLGTGIPCAIPAGPGTPPPSLEDPLEGLGRTVRCERYVRYALHHTHRTVCTVCTVCTARMVCTICIVCTVSTVRAVWDVYLLYLLRTVCTV
jgi:hypothetical protein